MQVNCASLNVKQGATDSLHPGHLVCSLERSSPGLADTVQMMIYKDDTTYCWVQCTPEG